MQHWNKFRSSISPPNKENRQSQALTRRDHHECDSTQVTIVELMDHDPLFDESLWFEKKDLTLRLFQERGSNKTAKFKERYSVGKQIGSGSYASVRLCTDRQLQQYALKIYNKQLISNSKRMTIIREIRLLQMIKHPNVIQIYDAIETNNHINLLLELVQGSPVEQGVNLKSIAYQIAQTLNYLHSRQITHRDIKIENLLYENGKVKLIDFGFSTLFSNQLKKKIYCGTPSYMAPEIVEKTYYRGPPVDIWALGVVLYQLQTGCFPFKGINDKELFYLIRYSAVSYSRVQDQSLTDLLQAMLHPQPDKRITAAGILNHHWFHETIPPRLQSRSSTKILLKKQSTDLINIYQILNLSNQNKKSNLSSVASNKSPIGRRSSKINDKSFNQYKL